MKKILLFVIITQLFFIPSFYSQTQNIQKETFTIEGNITDAITHEPLFGVNISAVEFKDNFSLKEDNNSTILTKKERYGAATNLNGKFSFNLPKGKYLLEVQYIGYELLYDTINISSSLNLSYEISETSQVLSEVVVSEGKYEQKISEVTVSMEILKPQQLENKNTFNLTTALTKLSGVDVNDGQISIRSSSGWSYGAGSRVIILMDDLPIMSADAGDVKWNYIPMENIAQVEVVKGAASALYGSSALGGVVNLRSSYPGPKPETNISYFVGIYGNPKEESWKWWGNGFYSEEGRNPMEIIGRKSIYYFVKPPMYSGLSFNHKQQFGNFDIVLGGNLFADEGYRQMGYSKNSRFNINMRYRFKKVEGLAIGVNSNFQSVINCDFFNWASDTLPYNNNPNLQMSSPIQGYRMNLDPFINYYTKNHGKISLRTRYFGIKNFAPDDTSRNSNSNIYYAEFQYTNTFAKRWTLTAGLVESYSTVSSNLFGNHFGNNTALYAQLDVKFGRLKISGGFRGEYFLLDTVQTVSLINIDLGKKTLEIPIKPVFRLGANYGLTETTFLRASIGQGYRFPAISEKFTGLSFSNGSFIIAPNPYLEPENGWNAEVGIKQGFSINGHWKGFADISVYHQQIRNMIEFTFAILDKNTQNEIPLHSDSLAAHEGNIVMGFIAKNIKTVAVTGVDLSGGIVGKINKATLSATLSYTYNYPIYKDKTPDFTTSTDSPLLKYRYKHSIKTDIQVDSRRIVAGVSLEWKSRIVNIDRMFCNEREAGSVTDQMEQDFDLLARMVSDAMLIPGYWDYRIKNAKMTSLNIDVNLGFKFSNSIKTVIIVRNLLNQAYVGRPSDMCAPRRFEVMVTFKL